MSSWNQQSTITFAPKTPIPVRMDKTEHTQRPKRVVWCKFFAVSKRRSSAWIEQVDGYRVNIEFAKRKREVHSVFKRLTHADDATSTRGHTRSLCCAKGVGAVRPLMGGDNGGVEVLGGFEVVVVAVDTGVYQTFSILGVDSSE